MTITPFATIEAAPEAARPVLEAVRQQLGVVPNLFRVIAHSPAALTGFSGFSAALGRTLDLRLRERIALAVAQVNGCAYCLSAHSYIAENVARISPAEITQARKASAGDARNAAAVHFAARVVAQRGQVTPAELQAVRDAGFSDQEIVEIIAVAVENIFTNLINNVARTEVDFPLVRASDLA